MICGIKKRYDNKVNTIISVVVASTLTNALCKNPIAIGNTVTIATNRQPFPDDISQIIFISGLSSMAVAGKTKLNLDNMYIPGKVAITKIQLEKKLLKKDKTNVESEETTNMVKLTIMYTPKPQPKNLVSLIVHLLREKRALAPLSIRIVR